MNPNSYKYNQERWLLIEAEVEAAWEKLALQTIVNIERIPPPEVPQRPGHYNAWDYYCAVLGKKISPSTDESKIAEQISQLCQKEIDHLPSLARKAFWLTTNAFFKAWSSESENNADPPYSFLATVLMDRVNFEARHWTEPTLDEKFLEIAPRSMTLLQHTGDPGYYYEQYFPDCAELLLGSREEFRPHAKSMAKDILDILESYGVDFGECESFEEKSDNVSDDLTKLLHAWRDRIESSYGDIEKLRAFL